MSIPNCAAKAEAPDGVRWGALAVKLADDVYSTRFASALRRPRRSTAAVVDTTTPLRRTKTATDRRAEGSLASQTAAIGVGESPMTRSLVLATEESAERQYTNRQATSLRAWAQLPSHL